MAFQNQDYEALIKKIPTSYATCSIGNSDTPLKSKLQSIASAGFEAVELAYPDLLSYVSEIVGHQVPNDDYTTICQHAQSLSSLLSELNLRILMLQPFSNFEGHLRGSVAYKDAFDRARGWCDVMSAYGIDMLQVGSSDTLDMTDSVDVMVADLRDLSDMLGERNFRICYENWCWATRAPDWKDVSEIVKMVDRDNVGLCLDTFQTAGGEWGDPSTASGKIEDKEANNEDLGKKYVASLEALSKEVPKEKIFLLQISDAYKPPKPIVGLGEDNTRPRGIWSHDFRPMPFDGGYLPIVEMTRAVLRTGFDGWFSMEIFDGGPQGEGKNWNDLEGFAKKAMDSHKRLVKEACSEA